MSDVAFQKCINVECGATYGVDEVLFSCTHCDHLLDVCYDWDRAEVPGSLRFFETRWGTSGRDNRGLLDFSGVWRFRELLAFADRRDMVTLGEGRTLLQQADALADHLGHTPGQLFLQYEGMNPSGSFKDNGMSAAFTMARRLRRHRVACASTGNTSAAMALYAGGSARLDGPPVQAIVFVGSGKIAFGKLSQALDYGALTLQIEGDFDACMERVRDAAQRLGLYLMNSVNPFRLEGQKTIMYRVLEGLDWQVPDWIVVPGGNLGNASAFGKAWQELLALGLVERVPRLAIINATGASTLHRLYNDVGVRWNGGHVDHDAITVYYERLDASGQRARTVASAIEINRPVNLHKALRSLEVMNGVVRDVPDSAILDHKALVGRHGLGCEPASAASVAGLARLLEEGVIGPDERVVCILTGHGLKDPDATVKYHVGDRNAVPGEHANKPTRVRDDIDDICAAIEGVAART